MALPFKKKIKHLFHRCRGKSTLKHEHISRSNKKTYSGLRIGNPVFSKIIIVTFL